MDHSLDSQEVINIIQRNLATIKEFGVASIGLFGSAARNAATIESDLDFLVEYKSDKLNFDSYMDLKFYLEELFGRKIDLVTTTSIKPALRDQIIQETIYAA